MLVFVTAFAPFSTIGYFTIFDYFICKNSYAPVIAKCNYLLYSNHYKATTKTKYRLDTNNLNSMEIQFMNRKNFIRVSDFFVIWIENVNPVVKTNFIHFNSMWCNFILLCRVTVYDVYTQGKFHDVVESRYCEGNLVHTKHIHLQWCVCKFGF